MDGLMEEWMNGWMGARVNACNVIRSELRSGWQKDPRIPFRSSSLSSFWIVKAMYHISRKLHIDTNFKRVVVIEPDGHLQTLDEEFHCSTVSFFLFLKQMCICLFIAQHSFDFSGSL